MYNVGCQFKKTINVSTSNAFSASMSMAVNEVVTLFEDKDFDVNMDIYTTSTFITVAGNPYQVEPPEPLYVRISEEDTLFRFTVVECHASPADDSNKVIYTFLMNKCPVDPSFVILHHDNNRLDFQIQSFQFITQTQSVVLHCRLNVCPIASSASQCNQTCSQTHRRTRRAIPREETEETEQQEPENKMSLRTVKISSQEIKFADMKTCADVTCGDNSVCVDAYPAVCACLDHFVLVDGVCTETRTFKMKDFHIQTEFFDAYTDIYSAELNELSTRLLDTLLAMLPESERKDIKNIKIINARKGSVIVDVIVAYSSRCNRTHAYTAIVDGIRKNNISTTMGRTFYIRSDMVPIMIEEDEPSYYYYYILLLFVLFIPAMSGLVFYFRQRKMKMKNMNNKPVERGVHFTR